MFKISRFLVVLAGIVLFSSVSDARVCFLAGSESDANCLSSTIDIESSKCPDKVLCEAPKSGSSVCVDAGSYFYAPEDCCSDATIYEPCNEEGMVCTGATCSGTLASGEGYIGCERGYCQCDSSYSETCDGEGERGVGEACGGKYKSCQCSSSFYACDASATCSGSTCSDDRGQLCSSCVCPSAGDGNWVSDPDTCCGSYTASCTNWPSGVTVYKCNTVSLPECVCGYTRDANKSQCINGCTDSSYEYQGNIPAHVVCNDYTNGISASCGNDCRCDVGYWDFTDNCTSQNDNICTTLGYTDTTCDGAWIGCPYDPSAKKCLGEAEKPQCTDGFSTDITSLSDCPADKYACTYYFKDANVDGCGKCYQTSACQAKGNYCTRDACQADTGKTCVPVSSLDFDANYPGSTQVFVCYEPEAECPDGYSEDITSASDCGTGVYVNGWNVETTTVGSKKCGKCVAKSCPAGSSIFAPLCTSGTVTTVGYSGNNACKQCMGGSVTINCCLLFDYDCRSVGGGCSNSSTYNGKSCTSCSPSTVDPVEQTCCSKGYTYDCTNIGRGCSNTQLGTSLSAQCMMCSTFIPTRP